MAVRSEIRALPVLDSVTPLPCSVASLGRFGMPLRPLLPCLHKGAVAGRVLR